MRKYRGKIRKKTIINKSVLPKKEEIPDVKEQMDSFELEYQKFIEELKAKKNEKTSKEENTQLLQSNG